MWNPQGDRIKREAWVSGVVHFSRRIPAGKQEQQQNAADAEEEEHSKQQVKAKEYLR